MIIAISGPTGSGKDTAANFIEKEFGFQHISGGNILREMLEKIGFQPKKEAVGDLGNLLRNNYGVDAIFKLVLEKAKSGDIVNSGFRSPAEGALIKNAGGFIIYIDAPESERHVRVLERSRDGENAREVQAIENKEAYSDNKLNESLSDVREMADIIISNDGSIDDFYAKIQAEVSLLIEKAA